MTKKERQQKAREVREAHHKRVRHKQVPIAGLPSFCTADEGCIELVQFINDSGLETMNSCQGAEDELTYELAYVQIGYSMRKAMRPAEFLAAMMLEMDRQWVRALRRGEHDFQFYTAISDGWCMYWHPSIYATVLEAAKKVMRSCPVRKLA